MKTKMIAAFLMLLMVTVANGFQSSTEWVKYTSSEGRYSALIPQQPKLTTQDTTTPGGDALKQYMAQTSDKDSFYVLGYFDYSPEMVFSLDKARDGIINATKGTLLNEESISLGGHPGRALKVSVKSGEFDMLIRARFYEVGRRIYILQHLFLKSSDSPAMANKTARFFDSFKVTAAR